MNELEKWYQENRARVEKMGVSLSLPSETSFQYIDGEYGRYMFRFIEHSNYAPDIEIINTDSTKTVKHVLDLVGMDSYSIYNTAINFIVEL